MANIDVAFVRQFNDTVIQLAQQMQSRLRDKVRVQTVAASAAYFDRLAPTQVEQRKSRHQDINYVNADWSRRKVSMADWEWGYLLDKQDDIRMLIDPQNPVARNGASAMNRQIDDTIVQAFTGDAQNVDASLQSTSVSFPSSQEVGKDIGSSNSNLNIEKLIAARKKLLENNVDLSAEQPFIVVNASAHESLLKKSEIQSTDFNTAPALVEGQISRYMGFNFVHEEGLQGKGTASTPRDIVVWLPSGMGMALGQDVQTNIDELPHKGYATQVYLSSTFGATRIEDEKVVSIHTVES